MSKYQSIAVLAPRMTLSVLLVSMVGYCSAVSAQQKLSTLKLDTGVVNGVPTRYEMDTYSSLPSSFSISRVWENGVLVTKGNLYVPTTVRPLGATTQWVTFNVRAVGQYELTGDHATVVLRTNQLHPPMNALLGHGITIGDVGNYPQNPQGYKSCSQAGKPAFNTQVEWFNDPTGNALFQSTCSTVGMSGAYPYPTYSIKVHSADNGYVAVWGADGIGRAVNTGHLPSTGQYDRGIFFGSTNGLMTDNRTFTLWFSNVKSGWL